MLFDEYNFKAREELSDQAADSICRYLDTLYERWEGFFHSKDYEEAMCVGAELEGAKKALSMAGYPVAFNWSGHRRKHFFPTESDVEMEKDWLYQCSD